MLKALTWQLDAQLGLGMTSGFLFGNPIPNTGYEIPRSELEVIIREALALADEACASGSDNTPFVLRAIKELSGGRTVLSNRVLVDANVRRGTQVAIELCRLRANNEERKCSVAKQVPTRYQDTNTERMPQQPKESSKPVDIFVAGALAIDLSCDYKPILGSVSSTTPQMHTSNPATIVQTLGGVAHNIAKAAHLAGASVRLCSAVGDDLSGATAINALKAEGMDTQAISRIEDARTAQYVSINDAKKDLLVAMADMNIFETLPWKSEALEQLLKQAQPKWFVIDANWEVATLERWLNAAKIEGCLTAFEPVSTAKAQRLFDMSTRRKKWVYPQPIIDLATPNRHELAAMHKSAREAGLMDREDWWKIIDALGIPSSGATTELARATSVQMVESGIPQQCIALLPFIPCIACKLGSSGVLLIQLLHENNPLLLDPDSRPFIISRSRTGEAGVGGLYLRLFPAVETVEEGEIVSVNGVGDTFLGTLLAELTRSEGSRIVDVVDVAQSASVMTLKSKEAVSPKVKALASRRRGSQAQPLR